MSQELTLQSKLTLRDGNTIPLLGFGTYDIEGREAYEAVTWALEDSAAWYYNEKEVGRAILDFCQKSNVPRSEIFYTTKLRSNDGHQASKAAIEKSLEECGLGYIDLYLIHGPLGGPQARMDSWKAASEAKAEGKIHSVGVSNYGLKHIQEMLDAGVEVPAVNQIDLHPFMTRTTLVDLCLRNGIALEAWAPLVRGYRFKHPGLVRLAGKYSKETAQVLLRYSLQKGFIPLPKSVSKERINSNTQIYDFELTADEMKDLDALDEHLITDWDPSDCP
ncbi:aldo-keto reductase [Phellopilus nigrolimitatus]|nr:aldo-keto reductase [Phellopilus nigrolimitatus]